MNRMYLHLSPPHPTLVKLSTIKSFFRYFVVVFSRKLLFVKSCLQSMHYLHHFALHIKNHSLQLECVATLCNFLILHCPDITVMVDWALKNKSLLYCCIPCQLHICILASDGFSSIPQLAPSLDIHYYITTGFSNIFVKSIKKQLSNYSA